MLLSVQMDDCNPLFSQTRSLKLSVSIRISKCGSCALLCPPVAERDRKKGCASTHRCVHHTPHWHSLYHISTGIEHTGACVQAITHMCARIRDMQARTCKQANHNTHTHTCTYTHSHIHTHHLLPSNRTKCPSTPSSSMTCCMPARPSAST